MQRKEGRDRMATEYDSALQLEAEGLATVFEDSAVDESGNPVNAVDLMRSSVGQEYDLGNGEFGFYYKRGSAWVKVALSRVTDIALTIELADASE
jgi:hypothetical protein